MSDFKMLAYCPRCEVDPEKIALCRTGPQSRIEPTCPNCFEHLRLGVTMLGLPGIPCTRPTSCEAEQLFQQMTEAA